MRTPTLLALSVVLPLVISAPESQAQSRNRLSERAQAKDYEYIVVGSGAGGGPLAARLALAGKRTLLIEAGDDQGANINQVVPVFHAYSTEDPLMAWDFYVNHYQNEAEARLDPKMTWTTPLGTLYVGLNPPLGSRMKGILYPRAGTLGGCTAHNALVTIYPHNRDWEHIERTTGDLAWNPLNMRRLFEKMENNSYATGLGHGTHGWLGVGHAENSLAFNDAKLLGLSLASATAMGNGLPLNGTVSAVQNLGRILGGDVNSASPTRDTTQGVYPIPLAMKNHRRNGSREFIMSVFSSKRYPLDIMYNTLVTKVTFTEGATPKATGVQYLQGKSLYRADPRAKSTSSGTPGSVQASAEVILAGGAFNTPQLLMLSGIGPAAELAKHNIPLVKDLPGVGRNLQDHMEIGVTHETKDAFNVIADCTYNKGLRPDPCLAEWRQGKGPYASSNGFIFSVIKKSSVAVGDVVYGNDPDLLMFGGIADFRGYYPKYSDDVYGHRNWTWVVLKAHTGNYGPEAGTVTLRSSDPRDTPLINFNFFDAGRKGDNAGPRDLRAMAEGVEMAREITESAVVPSLRVGKTFTEKMPGAQHRTMPQLMTHIRNNAWSHHASCTCKIGADSDPYAVLNSKLQVRGVQGLRVADASVFPRIPGFFVAVPTYMVGEQAAEFILNRRLP